MVFQDTTKGIKDGAIINGVFSVAPTKKVRFSQGTLLSKYDCPEESCIQNKEWSFSEDQYNFKYPTDGYAIDTFHTWGYNYNNCMDNTPIDGRRYDWGIALPIANGGNQAGLWRTLSADEWEYLLNTRKNANMLRGTAEIEGITGIVLLPDDWTISPLNCGSFFSYREAKNLNAPSCFDIHNYYSKEQWYSMQQKGAVFLPGHMNDKQTYWTTSTTTITNYSSGTSRFGIKFIRCNYNNVLIESDELFEKTAFQTYYTTNSKKLVRLVQDVE